MIIPTNNSAYNYNYSIDCDSDGVFEATNVTGDYTCTYPYYGTYTISIVGEFPHLFFPEGYLELSVDQWGTIKWQSMHRSFAQCSNMVMNATDTPDLSQVTDMSFMFTHAIIFDQPIGNWHVNNVTNMEKMFQSATVFNQDLSEWNVDNYATAWILPRPIFY